MHFPDFCVVLMHLRAMFFFQLLLLFTCCLYIYMFFFFGLLFICCIYMHDFIIFLGGITTMFARLLMILHFFLEHTNYVCKVADDFAFF